MATQPSSTPRLDMPFIMAAQAQKHVTHNEALMILDALVQPSVLALEATDPPALPETGDLYGLGPAPTGAWAGRAGALALWDGFAWRFIAPGEGWQAWDQANGRFAIFEAGSWIAQSASLDTVAGLGIGTDWDATNRLAVASEATLLTHDGAGHHLKVNKAADTDTAALLFQSGFTGHAEMGLAGNTDFSIKVSSDGAAWTDALRVDATSGTVTGAAIQSSPADTTPGRLMRADWGYGPGTLLGPVSEAGGLPTGAVIECGANANGAYVRFADGTQICTFEEVIDDLAIDRSLNDLFRSPSLPARPLPVPVVGPSYQNVSFRGSSDTDIRNRLISVRLGYGQDDAPADWSGLVFIASRSVPPTPGSRTIVQYVAQGRWF